MTGQPLTAISMNDVFFLHTISEAFNSELSIVLTGSGFRLEGLNYQSEFSLLFGLR